MKLTRRDALAVLAGTGVVGGSGAAAISRGALDAPDDDRPTVDETLDALVATAEVVYPSEVEGIPAFVETYSLGRVQDRPEYRRGLREAVARLDGHADQWFDGDSLRSLPVEDRETLLREMDVDAAAGRADGTTAERVRYYVVDELLYALYASPTGGKLVGIENPRGYPGGLESYQRGPQ